MLLVRGHVASHTADIARARVASAEAAAEGARSARWLSLHFDSGYIQTNEPMPAFGAILNQGSFDDHIDFNRPGTVDNFTARLEARYALYTGGRRPASERAARAGTIQAQAERAIALLELEEAVAASYFRALGARESLRALDAAIEALDESLHHARARENAGAAHVSIRLDIEAVRAQRTQQRMAMEEAAMVEKRRLAFLAALRPDELLSLEEADGTVRRWSLPDPEALERHPRRMAARAGMDAADAELERTRGARHPQLEAFARYQFDHGWRRDGEGDSWLAGVGVRVPLFDGFAIRSGIRRRLADKRAAEVQGSLVEAELLLQFRNAQGAWKLAHADLEAARARLHAARASVRLNRERFVAESVDSAELLGAEARFVDAQTASARGALNTQLALAHLRLAAGLSLVPEHFSR